MSTQTNTDTNTHAGGMSRFENIKKMNMSDLNLPPAKITIENLDFYYGDFRH